LVSSPAQGWAEDVSDPAKAEELIKQANDFRREGHDERAVPLLRQAYEIARTPRTAGQLGLAELALGYWAAAREHLTEALSPAGNHPWVNRNRAAIEAALATAKSHMAKLTVEGTPEGAEVLVNGKSVGTLPLPRSLEVSEGNVDVEVRAPGYHAASRKMALAGGTEEHVSLALVPVGDSSRPPVATSVEPARLPVAAPATSREAPPAPESAPTSGRILPWSLLAGAVAVASIGVWQHVEWRNSQTAFEAIRACGAQAPMRGSDSRCQGLYENLTTDRTRTVIAYGVAAALGVGAATVFIVHGGGAPSGEVGGGGLALGPGEMGISYRCVF
jgi:hypothetical protein